jgi:hypothetical protein
MREPTIAERIVFYFEKEVTEAHIDAVCGRLTITREEFHQHIPEARDLKIGPGFRLTPIYERDGWWTHRPTERIMTIAEHESLKRNTGEQLRNARIYKQTRLEGFANTLAKVLQGTMHAFNEDLRATLEISQEADYIIDAVDDAADRGRLIVRKVPA